MGSDRNLYKEYSAMRAFLNHSNRVRFRTKKSLFFSDFAAKFSAGGAANRTLSALNNKKDFRSCPPRPDQYS
jgi:hypothetical protein